MEEKKLKIYFTSDIHGYFYPTTYGDTQKKNIGLFNFAKEFKKDKNTLIIDGGDILQGSAFSYYSKQKLNSPKELADIMNECGYDYYTLGNHDFNYGLEYQKEYIKENKACCVCQNITDKEGNILYPYRIHVLENGLKIGIVGIVTDYINVWEKKENIKDVRITDTFNAIKAAYDKLKGRTDINIAIYHGGFECDLKSGERLSDTKENVGYKICQELGFDILLTGHQHMSIDGQWIHNTYVVQPAEYAKEYHYIEVSVSDEKTKIISKKCASLLQNLSQEMYEKHLPVEEEIQKWLDEPLGHLNTPLLPSQKLDMALNGSKIADFLNKVQLYFSDAMVSAVGLANEVAGFRKEVSVRDIIATYPYPNTLVVLEITGEQLKRAMERSAEYFDIDENGNVKVAESFINPKKEHYNYDYYMGIDYEIDPYEVMGKRIKNLKYKGSDIKPDDKFTMCLNNYRSSGTGGYMVYKECKILKEINVEMVELIMEYFRQNPYVEV